MFPDPMLEGAKIGLGNFRVGIASPGWAICRVTGTAEAMESALKELDGLHRSTFPSALRINTSREARASMSGNFSKMVLDRLACSGSAVSLLRKMTSWHVSDGSIPDEAGGTDGSLKPTGMEKMGTFCDCHGMVGGSSGWHGMEQGSSIWCSLNIFEKWNSTFLIFSKYIIPRFNHLHQIARI